MLSGQRVRTRDLARGNERPRSRGLSVAGADLNLRAPGYETCVARPGNVRNCIPWRRSVSWGQLRWAKVWAKVFYWTENTGHTDFAGLAEIATAPVIVGRQERALDSSRWELSFRGKDRPPDRRRLGRTQTRLRAVARVDLAQLCGGIDCVLRQLTNGPRHPGAIARIHPRCRERVDRVDVGFFPNGSHAHVCAARDIGFLKKASKRPSSSSRASSVLGFTRRGIAHREILSQR